jgi:hypothetical protein
MKQIIITLAPDGSMSAESAGVTGPACLEDVALIQALVPQVTIIDSKLTSAYFIQETAAANDQLTRNEEQDRI